MSRLVLAATFALAAVTAIGLASCQGQKCGPTTCRNDQVCCDVTCGVCGPMAGPCPPVHCLSSADLGVADAAVGD